MFVPDNADMLKLIEAFMGVHEDGVLDGIGPNKPDAPFFAGLVAQGHIDTEEYVEIAERLHKYT